MGVLKDEAGVSSTERMFNGDAAMVHEILVSMAEAQRAQSGIHRIEPTCHSHVRSSVSKFRRSCMLSLAAEAPIRA